jgi:molybdopterin molybdotransferase
MKTETQSPISADTAKEIILSSVNLLSNEQVDLFESHGRILAADIVADQDVPSFSNSGMDGYAIRASDTGTASDERPVSLAMIGELAAGSVFEGEVENAQALRIMTGAPIPKGADAVIEQELVTVRGGSVEMTKAITSGRNIRAAGEDIRSGDVVLKKGTRLGAAHLGVLASLGRGVVTVYEKPRVGILATGNEVRDPAESLEPGTIKNSNAYSLWGLVKETGAEPIILGIARDDMNELKEKLAIGLRNDVLITTGGVSVGAHDYVLKAFAELGVELKFWKVNIKPGMPLAFGLFRDGDRMKPVFSLPGNPVSTAVTFLQFVRPGLWKMMGMEQPHTPLIVKAALEHDIKKADKKRHFQRGILTNKSGRLVVKSTGWQGSGVLTSLTSANCLIIIPEDVTELKAGTEADVELL